MFIKLLFQVISRIRYVRNVRSIRWEQVVQNYLLHFIKWKEIDYASSLYSNPNVPHNKIMWIYWKQGLNNAPEIVKKCINSAKRYCGEYEVIILTDDNINQYVRLPEHIENIYKNGKMTEAHHSDLIRLVLLINYGGVWSDATCYFTDTIPQYIAQNKFFMFSRDLLSGNTFPTICSNWFILSKPGNMLLTKTFNYLTEYYKHYEKPFDYFIFHLVLSMIVRNDKDCKRIWEEKPYICNMNPHVFFYSFARPYKEDEFKHILSSCFVHKLTYKIDKKMISKGHDQNIISTFIQSKENY